MITLYFAPRTRSVRPRWILEELGTPYELVRVDPSDSSFLTINPRGEAPVLVDGSQTLFECLAMCLHLADLPSDVRLAPPVGAPERAEYYQWLVFAETIVDPLVVGLYDRSRAASEGGALRSKLATAFDFAERHLDGRQVLAGDQFSAADVSFASILHLANTLELLTGRTRLHDYTMRHCQRPAVRRAVAG